MAATFPSEDRVRRPRMFAAVGVLCALAIHGPVAGSAAAQRPRARDVGIVIGELPAGPLNAITDVPTVRVGHVTLMEGESIRTGVTAILPHDGNLFQQKVPAAIVVGNGFGKLVGVTQVRELGTLESPIVLTNTLSVFTAADATIDYLLELPGNEEVRSVNPVVGETNDGYLNDIRARAVRREHVREAIRAARGGPVEEGAVGAGTGTRCFAWKGGIGTSSRQVRLGEQRWTVGVLVQSNFGGRLVVAGAPVGAELARRRNDNEQRPAGDDGSCMIVVATDAPLDPRQLTRLARRALLGLGATGSVMSHGSGDYVIAFSTGTLSGDTSPPPDALLTPAFAAVRDATEEAVLNSLFRAESISGFQGRKVEALPLDAVLDICRRHRVLR